MGKNAPQFQYKYMKMPDRKGELVEVIYADRIDATKYPWQDLPRIRAMNGVGRPPKNKIAAVAQR